MNKSDALVAIRKEIMQDALQMQLEPELLGLNYVDMIPEFKADEYVDISISGSDVFPEFNEGGNVSYVGLDFGKRTFRYNVYRAVGNRLSEAFIQDSIYAAEVVSKVPTLQAQAVAKNVEKDIWQIPQIGRASCRERV